MTLIKEKDSLYQFKDVIEIAKFDAEVKSIVFYFQNGLIIKFIFENSAQLYNAFNRLEGALLTDESVIIDTEWTGAVRTTINKRK